MTTPTSPRVTTRQLSWEEMCRKAEGKDWDKPVSAYEFSGRVFTEPNPGGPYAARQDEASSPGVEAQFRMGVNLAGAEFEVATFPTQAEVSYFAGRRIRFIRLPIGWEHVQPVPYEALEPSYVAKIVEVLDWAAQNQSTVLIDLHNYGGRGANKLGDGVLLNAAFADVWTRMATVFRGHAGLHGYDIMNEPSNMPNAGAWPAAAQACVDAIRKVDAETRIYIEGDGWASAAQWTNAWTGSSGGGNANLDIRDPSNRIVYSAHCYCDNDNSGRYILGGYDNEVAASGPQVVPPGTGPSVGATRIAQFVQWGKARGHVMHIGEIGVPNDDPRWLECLDQALEYCRVNNVEASYWAAGPAWGSYFASVELRASGNDSGLDARQMAVLTKFSGAPQDTRYYIDGPLRGDVGEASTFRVEYRGRLAAPVVVTLNDNGDGGQFSTTAVTLAAGVNSYATFTYTASVERRIYLRCTNAAGLTDPAALLFVTKDDFFRYEAVTAENIFSLRRIYMPYTGPAIRLRRTSDNAEQTFNFLADENIDVAAITAWAAGSPLRVVTWYDQGPKAQHAGAITDTDNQWGPGQTFAPASANDQPLFILDGQNGHPVIRRSGHRQDAASTLDSLTGHTVMATFKPTAVASATWFAAWELGADYSIPGATSQWSMSDESSRYLQMAVNNDDHHNYVTRWAADSTNGRQSFRDGVLVSQADTTHETLSGYQYMRTMNLGWFKYGAAVSSSLDECERVVFSGSVSDETIAAYQVSAQEYWDTYVAPEPVAPGPGPKLSLLGVNWSGLEFGGTPLTPDADVMDYWLAKGITCVRLPFSWHYIQPTDRGALDSAVLAQIDTCVSAAVAGGAKVVLDLHNYADDPFNGNAQLTTSTLSQERIADVWSRLATHFLDEPDVLFGIMNEPRSVWSTWKVLQNAAIAAIRATGATQKILVQPGSGGTIGGFLANGTIVPSEVVDAGDNWAIEFHQYFDATGSGTLPTVQSATIGLEILKSLTAWGDAQDVQLFLGEFGAGANENARDCLEGVLRHLQRRSDRWLGATVWGGGGRWPDDYPILADPYHTSPTIDQIQVAPMFDYLSGGSKYGYVQPAEAAFVMTENSATYADRGAPYGQSLTGGYLSSAFHMYPVWRDFTVQARVKAASAPAASRYITGANGVTYLGANSSGNAIALADNVQITSTVNICDNADHELELCMDASTARLFVDGVLAASASVTRATAAGGWSGNIGTKTSSESTLWPGEIAYVATWGVVKHTSGFTPPTAPPDGTEPGLIAVWHCNGNGNGLA